MLCIRRHMVQWLLHYASIMNCGSMLFIHSSYLSGINMWLNSVHQSSIWQCCASCINMAHFRSVICIKHQSGIMAQYCASCIKIMVQSACAPWLIVVHPQLIDVHQALILYGSVLCISHQYGSVPQYAISMAHCCASGISMTQLN